MSPTLIVDCGSGFTRAAVFQGRDGRVHCQEAHAYAGLSGSFAQRRIVDVLVEGGLALREWVMGIRALSESTGCGITVVGATGGLRQAELDGTVTPAMLTRLAALLRDLVPRVEFLRLSSEDEAQAELAAVQYVTHSVLPSTARRPIGMLSSGGMTSQAGWHTSPDATASFLSVTHGLNDAASALREQPETAGARRDALVAFESRMSAAVDATGLRGRLAGTFVAIEMVGALGSADDYLGSFATLSQQIGRQLVSKAQLVAALQQHLREWQAQTGPVADRHGAYAGLLPATLLSLTALTDDTATFYVCRVFEVAPNVVLQPSWSLGLFVVMMSGGLESSGRLVVASRKALRSVLPLGAVLMVLAVAAMVVAVGRGARLRGFGS